MIRLLSSHGHADFDDQGLLVESKLDPAEIPLRDVPKRLDVAEFIRRYPGEQRAGEWDILDWAFWTHNGDYVQAQREGFK